MTNSLVDLIPDTPKPKNKAVTWRALCKEWAASGETQSHFCKRKGLQYSTFVYWRIKFRKKEKKLPSSIKPVKVVASKAVPADVSREIQILLPNHTRINLPADIDASTMVCVLKNVKFISC